VRKVLSIPVSLLILLVFVNRYVLGLCLKKARRERFDETRDDWQPTVTVVVPMFNEGKGIYDTILSLLACEYPAEKLFITVVDDCSRDDSYVWAVKAQALHTTRVMVLKNQRNVGKRCSIIHAVRRAQSEIIVSVDSDVIVEKGAIAELVRRFVEPDIAAVGGRVNVLNANANWLTRMQAIKYYFGYEYLKNLERSFRSVMCLSGCLTAYRREVLIALEPVLENRNVLGVPIKYGEDRYLTRHLVKAGYRTVSTLDAVCSTVAPDTLAKYFSQQLRWRRSNLIDYFAGLSHAWRLHPVVAIHYLSLLAMLFAYPTVIAANLASGEFWGLSLFSAGIFALLGAIYAIETRELPPDRRVSPIWFLPMAVVMPVSYLLITPLALFTLDSSSWETRGHGAVRPLGQRST
jgi:cellulose synthase/poly-beta-1,6-N-acetylglucosamine synthase-like glycosyltransferase